MDQGLEASVQAQTLQSYWLQLPHIILTCVGGVLTEPRWCTLDWSLRLKKPQATQQMNKQKPTPITFLEKLYFMCCTNIAQNEEQGLCSLQLCFSSPESFISQIFKSSHH